MIFNKKKTNGMNGIKRAFILPDTHAPYHDKRAYNLALQVADDFKPDEFIIGGDFADYYAMSSYCKAPSKEALLKREVRIAKEMLKDLTKRYKSANIVYLEGNHEDRLSRYIASKAPELFGLVNTEQLLELDRLDITFIPYAPDQAYKVLGSKLLARHEPLGNGVHASHATATKAMASVVHFHTHRKDESHIVSLSGKDYRTFCPGWLGDKRSEVFNYVKNHHQWTLGFAIVYIFPNGNFLHQVIDITDYKCIFNGKLYKS